jgi:DNA ligase-associated metallophosphoesterase
VLSIAWAGQKLDLLAGRGVSWRRARTLIIADSHFGKAAAFRRNGIPVPAGTTQADVARLSAMLDETGAERLIILGDFLHHRDGRAPGTMTLLQRWRRRYPSQSLEVVLVRGNHDLNAGDPPPELDFQCADEPHVEENFAFCHRPAACGNGSCSRAGKGDRRLVHFAGHIHPCAVLRDRDGSRLRVPCFCFASDHAVLPAFGTFTGSHAVRFCAGDRVFAVGQDEVIEIRRRAMAPR